MYSDGSYGYLEWYIVFTRAKYPHWIWRIVDRDMGHVYAIKSLNDYQWLIEQPRVNYTDQVIRLKSQYPNVRMLVDSDDKILKVRIKPQMRARGFLCWFTCVEQIKAYLGIRSFFLITPKQLYNYLRMHDG